VDARKLALTLQDLAGSLEGTDIPADQIPIIVGSAAGVLLALTQPR